jgi:DNA-binding PadR family transcriptional regulator
MTLPWVGTPIVDIPRLACTDYYSMNLSRLMILGLLSDQGPMHGHQIRRTGELTNAEVWGGITGGALYAELRRLQRDELVRPLREEQVGRFPARTVYEITDEGRIELAVQRNKALDALFPYADPVSVVLLFAVGADPTELDQRLAARREKVQTQRDAMVSERTLLTEQGVLPPMAITAFRRGELRLEAELRWHEEFERQRPRPGRSNRRPVRMLQHPEPGQVPTTQAHQPPA